MQGTETDEGLVLSWTELVSFGIWSSGRSRGSPRRGFGGALPELLRPTELELRIARMEVVALERLAATGGETVSAALARGLRDLVSVHSRVVVAGSARIRRGVVLAGNSARPLAVWRRSGRCAGRSRRRRRTNPWLDAEAIR